MELELKLEGLVTDIIYSNDDNGYTVCEVETDEDTTVFVGIMPGIQPGENIQAEGKWKTHPTYGEQFCVEKYEKTVPQTKKGIEKYLASGVIKGIGQTLAKRIVDKFGINTLETIEQQPEKLAEVKGISEQKAQDIGMIFYEQRELRRVMLFLQDYYLSPNLVMKIYKKYKDKTIDIVKENPYKLADEIQGIGFKKADVIAEKLGIDKQSIFRIKAGIKFILLQGAQNGHTYLPEKKLLQRLDEVLDIESVLIKNALIDLQIKGEIVQKGPKEDLRIYLKSFYNAEMNCATKILELAEFVQRVEDEQVYNDIKIIEAEGEISLAENQKEAVFQSLVNGVLIITGGPGTGKTTTINTIIKLLEKEQQEILLAAPTGRAAKRMSEATGREALTIHRLLENNFVGEDSRQQMFQRNEENPLETDVIIIDEVSMVDILLMNSLLRAIPHGTRIILVGDVDQLPSVGAGNVLHDLINCEVLKVVKLNEIFRQASESAIIMNAHRINTGQYPKLNEKGKDFFFVRKAVQEEVVATIIDLMKRRLPKFAKCSAIDEIQVLTPMRKGTVGVEALNQALQQALNPPSKSKKEKEYRQNTFREGDKVMQIKNNYNLPWKVFNRFNYPINEGVGIFNGDVGKIQEINHSLEKITVAFEDKKVVEYDYSNLEELELAYAITIHKSQGSEHPIVIIPVHSGPIMLLSRNLLYTAVTRAKRYVVLVGTEEVIKRMVDNKREINRYSTLSMLLKENYNTLKGR